MDLPESNTHSFVIKVYLEETAEEAGRATWRGHITHVPSEKRSYLKDLDDITAFIARYLKRMGVQLSTGSRPESRVKRLRTWLGGVLGSRSVSEVD